MQLPANRRTGKGKQKPRELMAVRETKARATSGSIIQFFAKELWETVGDGLF